MTRTRELLALLALPVVCIAVSLPLPAVAQEAAEDPHMHYIADYKVAWEDFPEWIRSHQEHGVALLDSLVAEDVITGWSAWQHNTGSDYNWRMVVEAADWTDFDTFWEEYRGRYPREEVEAFAGAFQAHRDQVWDVAEARVPESADDIRFAYQALYQVDFDELEEWQERRETVVVPVLEQAMADGILAGWVVEDHNTGDRFNRSEVYLFDDWDDMDDLWSRVISELMVDEEVWDRVGGMIRAHDDAIWESVPRGGSGAQ